MKTERTVTTMSCDRCAKTVEMMAGDKLDTWGSVHSPSFPGIEDDICPECVESYDRWWNAKNPNNTKRAPNKSQFRQLEDRYKDEKPL